MIQADPNKFYAVFRAGLFPYYSWETGEFEKFEITKEYAKSVADCYDKSIYKSPTWIGHPYSGAPSLAWIAASKYDDGKIYNSFEWIDEELIEAVRKKSYQFVSVEFGRVMDIDNDYQVALGITNAPRVSKQKPLDFGYFEKAKSNALYAPITNSFSIDLVKDFTASDKKYFFQNQNKKNSMNELLKRLAQAFSIDLNLFNTDEAVTTKLTEVFSAMSSDKKALEDKVKALEDERVKFALDQAIGEGRIKPADKDSYESLLKGNFEAARKVMFDMPVNPALKPNAVPSGGSAIDDPTNPGDKFSNEDGSKMTFAQFSEKIVKDPSFAKKFTDEEIASIPGASEYYQK